MIALLGGRGYIGSCIASKLRELEISFEIVRRSEVNYYRAEALVEKLERIGASFVINAAGYTGKPNVDACERFKSECLLGNAVLPGVVRDACHVVGIPFGHVSSGCIFTGDRPSSNEGTDGFREQDAPNFCFRTNNCSFYSGCKALGEEVLSDCKNCYVWRLRIPFNHIDGDRNYLSKLLRYPRLLDARNSLTHLDEFAECCIDCIERKVPFGIYNLTNGGSVTTREVTEMLARIVPQKTFNFFESEAEFMQMAAVAPRSNCVLDNSKAMAAGLPLSPIEVALERAIANWEWSSARLECKLG